jgi:uncharacterized protein (DUF427 family)
MTKITIKNNSTDQIIAQGVVGQDVVALEGNYYFNRDKADISDTLEESDAYTCPIKKSTCDYYFLKDEDGEKLNRELCWIYERITNSLFKAIEGKVGFYGHNTDNGANVTIEEV